MNASLSIFDVVAEAFSITLRYSLVFSVPLEVVVLMSSLSICWSLSSAQVLQSSMYFIVVWCLAVSSWALAAAASSFLVSFSSVRCIPTDIISQSRATKATMGLSMPPVKSPKVPQLSGVVDTCRP